MAFDSRAYRILIASPSDVAEEREIAVSVIQAWNDLNSHARNVVLLPLRWETHTAPEYNTRPQEAINRAIVDDCDLLLGIFWTRIGTPTGVADSGSLEEIERVAAAGKPVMLYFSQVSSDPYLVDSGQFQRLREFKSKTQQHALTESFKSQIEFRDKFSKQLEMKVRDLQKEDAPAGHKPPLVLELFAKTGPSVQRRALVYEVIDFDAATSDDTEEVRLAIRAAADEAIKTSNESPIVLSITNTGRSGIRNLFIQVLMSSSSETLRITQERSSDAWASKLFFNWDLDIHSSLRPLVDDYWDGSTLRKDNEGWHYGTEWDALQPLRTRLIKPLLFVNTFVPAQLEIQVKIYADSFPEPLMLTIALELSLENMAISLEELLPKKLSKIRADAQKKQ